MGVFYNCEQVLWPEVANDNHWTNKSEKFPFIWIVWQGDQSILDCDCILVGYDLTEPYCKLFDTSVPRWECEIQIVYWINISHNASLYFMLKH